MPVIEVQGLHKRYGEKVAVDDVPFTVDQGEIFGILGPNGAGKTTTAECIEGLRTPDRGSVSVLGMNPLRERAAVTQRLGSQLQESQLPDKLRVLEALELFASFYPNPADPVKLLETLGIGDKRDTAFKRLSGGQKQRLSIALALIGNPEIAVLDELTTGLDPQARQLGADRGRAGPRRDDRAGHAFHGGGGTAVRPAGVDRPRPGRRARLARRAGVHGGRRAAHPVPAVAAAGRGRATGPAGGAHGQQGGRAAGRHRRQQRAARRDVVAGPQAGRRRGAAGRAVVAGRRVRRAHRPQDGHRRHHPHRRELGQHAPLEMLTEIKEPAE